MWAAFVVGVLVYLGMVSLLIWEELKMAWTFGKGATAWVMARVRQEGGQGGWAGLCGEVRDEDEASREARLRSGVSSPASPATPASRDEKEEKAVVAALEPQSRPAAELEVA